MKVTIDLGDIKNECFVLMPFGPKFDPIYEEVLRPAIEEIGLVPARADLTYGSRRIMRDVWNGISTARIVIAELTGGNPNVLYELGMAHALGKPFVIITNSMGDVPFDLKELRCIVYDKDHPKWGDSLARNVARTMRSVLEEVNEHGPLFQEIETDVEYSKIDPKTSDRNEDTESRIVETQDISGVWKITQKWEDTEDCETILSIQQRSHSLSGFAITSPYRATSEENRWRLSQEISGFIRGNKFEISATSYQILESNNEISGWSLDNWQGTAETTDFIQGETQDEAGEKGRFWGERISEEPIEEKSINHPTPE